MSVVTLLTDFGTADGYVAEMKGAILRLAPGTQLVDLSHEIAPGDIAAGAFTLGRAWKAFAPGSVHLAVVDPGVGTARRGLALSAGGHFFVGPDNGLFSDVLPKKDVLAVALPQRADAAPTFHGRDVFAPAAAALAAGKALASLGAAVTDPVRLPAPRLERRGASIVGTVVHVDRFGTLITNIPGTRVKSGGNVRIGAYDVPLRSTFADVAPGDLVAFIGSGGTLEIALRDGRADTTLGMARGVEVTATAKKTNAD